MKKPLSLIILVFCPFLFAANVTWRQIGPATYGAMFGVAYSFHNPDIIAAGTDMGLAFITTNNGARWKTVGKMGQSNFAQPGYRGTWAAAFDPNDPDVVWLGSTYETGARVAIYTNKPEKFKRFAKLCKELYDAAQPKWPKVSIIVVTIKECFLIISHSP